MRGHRHLRDSDRPATVGETILVAIVMVLGLAGFAGLFAHALWVSVVVAICGAFVLVVAGVAYWNLRRADTAPPVEDDAEPARPGEVAARSAPAATTPRDAPPPVPSYCATLLVAVPSERRAEIAECLSGTRDHALLRELVRRRIVADEVPGPVALAFDPSPHGRKVLAARVQSTLEALARREHLDAAGGFRDGVALCSNVGPGTSVLAIVVPSRSASADRPRSRLELADRIDRLAPLTRDRPLAFEVCWVPTSEDRAFDDATLWEAFPELTRLPLEP